MLSGALNLDPARREGAFAFYRRRLTRVGLPLLFWSGFYFVWWAAYQGRDITIHGVLEELFAGLTSSHLYYLVLILGLYFCAPALRVFVRRTGPAGWWGLAAGLLALAASGFVVPRLPRNAFTLFVPYLGYFVVGLALRELTLTQSRVLLAWATFLAATVAIAIGTGLLFDRWGPTDYRAQSLYDYLHPAVIAQSLAVFLILRSGFAAGPETKCTRLLRVLGPLAFGIYLVHVAILDVVQGFLGALYVRAAAFVIPLEVLVVFVLSTGVAAALRHVPYLRRVIG
jgi:surface polysaccharide O-acyltransferase-like enzyme